MPVWSRRTRRSGTPRSGKGWAGHRVDAVLPGVKSVTMQETTLRLLYDEALDPASQPAASAYTLAPGGNPIMVAISGSTVTLTFAPAPAEGATVTLAYAAPALNPVKDAGGNPAPTFTGLTVVRGPVVMSIDLGAPPTTKPAMSLRLHRGAALEQCPRAEGVQGP